MAVLYIFVIMIMRVIQSIYNKRASLKLPDSPVPYAAYLTLSKGFAAVFSVITLLISFDMRGIECEGVVIALCSGIFLSLSSLCGIKALKQGTMVLSSVCSTAGLLIPSVAGIFLFDEKMNVWQFLCIGALLVGVVMLVGSAKEICKNFNRKSFVYLLGSFITNGLVMLCQKLFGKAYPEGNVTMFSLLTFLLPTIMLAILTFIVYKKERASKDEEISLGLPKELVIYSIVLAFAVFIVQQFVTLLTPLVSSAVLFTFVNGGATVISAIVGAIMYKEKLTSKSVCGIIICLASLIFIKIFE